MTNRGRRAEDSGMKAAAVRDFYCRVKECKALLRIIQTEVTGFITDESEADKALSGVISLMEIALSELDSMMSYERW